MTCHHVFTPWIKVPTVLYDHPIMTRRCQICGMSAVRVSPSVWVVEHPRDVYDQTDFDYDQET